MTEIVSEPGSKVQVLSAPVELPGVCALCGSSGTDDRQYIAIGLFIEFHGEIYFCTICMGQVANTIGYVKAETSNTYKDLANVYRQKYESVLGKERICREFIRASLSADFVEPVVIGTIVASIIDDKELEELTRESSENDTGTAEIDKRTEQPDSVERSDDVPSTTSSNGHFEL